MNVQLFGSLKYYHSRLELLSLWVLFSLSLFHIKMNSLLHLYHVGLQMRLPSFLPYMSLSNCTSWVLVLPYTVHPIRRTSSFYFWSYVSKGLRQFLAILLESHFPGPVYLPTRYLLCHKSNSYVMSVPDQFHYLLFYSFTSVLLKNIFLVDCNSGQ